MLGSSWGAAEGRNSASAFWGLGGVGRAFLWSCVTPILVMLSAVTVRIPLWEVGRGLARNTTKNPEGWAVGGHCSPGPPLPPPRGH